MAEPITEAEITFRFATPDDAAIMVDYLDTLRAEGLDTIHPPKMTVEEEREFLQEVEDNDRGFMLVALCKDRVVGMLYISSIKREHSRHKGALGITLMDGYRGRGLGTTLMELAEKECRTWPGFCRMELDAVEWNERAIALYERLGFEHEGRQRKAINLRGKPEDLILMAKVWEV